MELIAQEEAELALDELNTLDKKSGFIELVNDDDKNTINQEMLAEKKSSNGHNNKNEIVANVF